ncbi:MAG: patatin-like phospholipase family protein [Pseudomonadota bacterium]|nr:patatin-like phospholipase family protein [Pseudomonadota bacterium]
MAPLEVYAGANAIKTIQKQGFTPDIFSYFLGASGGPKWFSLAGLDRVLFPEWFANVNHQIHVIGSSAGAFRTICAVQDDPLAAINRLAESYSTTTYSSNKPTPREITQKAEDLLKYMVNDEGKQQVLANSRFKAHLIVAKCLGATRFESKVRQLSGLAMSAAVNTVSRKNLKRLYQRYVFSTPNTDFSVNDPYNLPTHYHALTQNNIHSALLASGSIPVVIEGVTDIEGAPAGMYRDGGIIDYHFDLSFGPDNGLVLYPHFYNKPIPGWFDKGLKGRVPHRSSYDNVVMLVPSASFVANLPYSKIPDRKDFEVLDASTRIKYWQTVLKETDRLGEYFMNTVHDGSLINSIKPLPFNQK